MSPRAALMVPLSPLGPVVDFVDPSFRALSGRLKFTVRRHKFNKDSISLPPGNHGVHLFGICAEDIV